MAEATLAMNVYGFTYIEIQCSELIDIMERHTQGDADYSIEIYECVGFQTDTFAKLLKESERLKRTSVMIVALGDDDTNIDVAVYIRKHLIEC